MFYKVIVKWFVNSGVVYFESFSDIPVLSGPCTLYPFVVSFKVGLGLRSSVLPNLEMNE